MTGDVIIGIDAGTSIIKSVAFTTHGGQIAVEALPNRYETLPGGGAEQGMARTWTDTAMTLRGLAEKVPDLASRVAAVAVTGQGDGTWLIDGDGEPVAPALLWLDARAAPIVDAFRNSTKAKAHYFRTGTGLAACQQGSQMLWLRQHRPEALAAAATAFHCKDWLYFNLTGVRATDPAEGTFTFGDFRNREYSEEVLDLLGLSKMRQLLPPILEGTQHWHRLTPEAARATGLTAGTPVVLGYLDVPCTIIGAGLLDRGQSAGCTIIGSTGMHIRIVQGAEHVVLNEACTGFTMPLPMPGIYGQMQSNLASTLNIDWLIDIARDVLAAAGAPRERAEIIAGLDPRVLAGRPAALLFHPYISEAGERGPFIDARARASFVGLSTRHGYADLMRAVYEGLAFAARDCYLTMGSVPAEIRLTGGAARSRALRAIVSAVLGADVRTTSREETGAAGAAMMAAVSLGAYSDLQACTADWAMPLLGPRESPDAQLAQTYLDLFPAYVAARRALEPIWHAMARQPGV